VRILLVDSDGGRAEALGEALTAAGGDVTLAPSGSFALTMLEWDRHDVVVSRARLGDMDGHELCAILRDDAGMKELRFALIAQPEEVGASIESGGIDLILPSTMSPTMMLARITRLVPDVTPLPGEEPEPSRIELEDPEPERSARSFAGSLDDIELGELARTIARAGRTGHLLVALGSAGGAVAFEGGRVVHAEFGDETGRPAFASLVGAARRGPAGEFCFVADDTGGLRGTPRTVHNAIDELLRGS
jgi:DNA-binding response OmpR family regulator